MAKYNINLGFEIDTNKMDKALRDITAKINELNKKGTLNGLIISDADKTRYLTEMTQLRDAVARVFTERKFGTDPTLRMGAASPEIEAAARSMNTLNQSLGNNSIMAQRAVAEQVKMAEQMKKSREQVDPLQKALNKLTGSFQAIAMFSLAQFGFRGLTGTITDAIAYIEELDKAMTGIRVVTGATTTELQQFATQYNKMGRELGRTTVEVASAFENFYRQGREGAEATKMVQATMIGATIAGEGLVEVADKLTAMINGFQLAGEEAMSVMDKFAILDANMATSFKEMSYAMTKIASSAHNANMSIDETLSLVATVSEVTREAPENIGTAWKTIVARMRGITDTGAITDETVQDMNKVDKALRTVGISQRDATGEMRNTFEVLNELGQKWESLNTKQQAYVATAVAGSRQTTRFYAAIENWDKVMSAHDLALNSSGAALQQFEQAQEGVEFQMNQTRAATEKLYTMFTNSQTIIGANQAYRALIETFTGFLSVVNPMSIAIFAVNRGLASLAKQKLSNIGGFSDLFRKGEESALRLARQAEKQQVKEDKRTGTPRMEVDASGTPTGKKQVDALREQRKELESISLTQKQYNLLTQAQKDQYDAMQKSLQTNRLIIKEAEVNTKVTVQLEEQLRLTRGTSGAERIRVEQQVLALRNELGYTDIDATQSAEDINRLIQERINAESQLATQRNNMIIAENRATVQRMAKEAMIKNIMGEALALGMSLLMARISYNNALNSAADRFQAETAKIQYQMQATVAITQALGNSAQGVGQYMSTLGGNLGKIGGAIGPIVGGITQVASLIITSVQAAKQYELNQIKKRFEEAEGAVENFIDKTKSIKELQKELLGLGDTFDRLRQGVDENGKNMHLTNEEFHEYNNIANKIAELLPTMVLGYTEQGNAIINNSIAMTDYIQKLKDAEAAEAALAEGSMATIFGERVKQTTYERVGSTQSQYMRGEDTGISFAPGRMFSSQNIGDTGTKMGISTGAGAAIGAGVAVAAGVGSAVASGTALGAALGSAIPVAGTIIGALIGAGAGLLVGTLLSSFNEGIIDNLPATMEELETSSKYLNATIEDQRAMEENVKKRMGMQARADKQLALSAKKDFDNNYEILKLTSDTYKQLNEQDQKQVDLVNNRLEHSEVYAKKVKDMEAELFASSEWEKVKDDKEKREELYETRLQEIMVDMQDAHSKIVEALSEPMNAAEIDRILTSTRYLEESLAKGVILTGDYVDQYDALEERMRNILIASGVGLDLVDDYMANFELSGTGEQFVKLIDKLSEYGFKIEDLQQMGIDLSVDTVQGIDAIIDSYTRLTDVQRGALGDFKTFAAALQQAIELDKVRGLGLDKQIETWQQATKTNNWREQNAAMKEVINTLNSLGLTSDAAAQAQLALSRAAIQVEVDVDKTRQIFNSYLREMKTAVDSMSDYMSILEKVGEDGRLSLSDTLDFISKFPDAVHSIKKDAEGLLVVDTADTFPLMMQGYHNAQKSIKELKVQMEDAQMVADDWNKIVAAGSLAKSFDINNVEGLKKQLESLKTADIQTLQDWGFANQNELLQVLENWDHYTQQLEPIMKRPPDEARRALISVANDCIDQVKLVQDAIAAMQLITLDVYLNEQIQTREDKLSGLNKQLRDYNRSLRDTDKRIAELESGKAETKIFDSYNKAVKTFDKTMKKLAEDEVLNVIKYQFTEFDFALNGVNTKMESVKTSLDLIGDTDPSQSLLEYNNLMDLTAQKAELLHDEMNELMTMREPQSAAEAKEVASKMQTTANAIMDNYKQSLDAQKKIQEINNKMSTDMRANTAAVTDSIVGYSNTINSALDRSLQLLRQGSMTGGIGLQKINVFERVSKAPTDPIALMKWQNEQRIIEHQKYLDKINELNRKSAKMEYEDKMADIEESRAAAYESLINATEQMETALQKLAEEIEDIYEKRAEIQESINNTANLIERLTSELDKLKDMLEKYQSFSGMYTEGIFSPEEQDKISTWLLKAGISADKAKELIKEMEKVATELSVENAMAILQLKPEDYEDVYTIATHTLKLMENLKNTLDDPDVKDKAAQMVTRLMNELEILGDKNRIKTIVDTLNEELKNGILKTLPTSLKNALEQGFATIKIEPEINAGATVTPNYKGTTSLKQYAHGTQEGISENQHALVGELGPEAAILPDGQMKMLGENGPEMAYLPKGTIIYNHKDTELLTEYINNPEGERVKNYSKGSMASYYNGTAKLNAYANGTTKMNNVEKQQNSEVFKHIGGAKGQTVVVYDLNTGRAFGIEPISFSSSYHLDWVPSTANEASKITGIAGGFSWTPRPSVAQYNGRNFISSYHTMPHAGGRSGRGFNIPKNNGYDSASSVGSPGHACLHFPGSASKANNYGVSPKHQTSIEQAWNMVQQLDGAIPNTGKSITGNAGVIYNLLIKSGFTHAGAIASLGNIQGESNFNPLAVGDNGTSVGLIQWHKGRADAMKAWSSKKGMNWKTIEAQIGYYLYELETGYSSLFNELKDNDNSAASVSNLVRRLVYEYERPADPAGGTSTRTKYAMDFFGSGAGGFELWSGNLGELFSIGTTSSSQRLDGYFNDRGEWTVTDTTQPKPEPKTALELLIEKMTGKTYKSSGFRSRSRAHYEQAYVNADQNKILIKKPDREDMLVANLINDNWVYTDESKKIDNDILKKSFEGLAKYAQGTEGTPRTEPALVGENGEEVAIFPNGKMKTLGVNGPEIVNLPQGTIIYNNRDTRDIKKYIPNVDNQTISGYKDGTTKLTKYANGVNTQELMKMFKAVDEITESVNNFTNSIQNLKIDNKDIIKQIYNQLKDGTLSNLLQITNNNLSKSLNAFGMSQNDIDKSNKNIQDMQTSLEKQLAIFESNDGFIQQLLNENLADITNADQQWENFFNSLGKELGSTQTLIRQFNMDFDSFTISTDLSTKSAVGTMREWAAKYQNASTDQRMVEAIAELTRILGAEGAKSILGNEPYITTSALISNFSQLQTNTTGINKSFELTETDLETLRKQFQDVDSELFKVIKTLNKYNITVEKGMETYEQLLTLLSLKNDQLLEERRLSKDYFTLRQGMTVRGELDKFEETMTGVGLIDQYFNALMESIGGAELQKKAEELGVSLTEYKETEFQKYLEWASNNVQDFKKLMGIWIEDDYTGDILTQALENFKYIMDEFGIDVSKFTKASIQKAQAKMEAEYERLKFQYSFSGADIINKQITKFNQEMSMLRDSYNMLKNMGRPQDERFNFMPLQGGAQDLKDVLPGLGSIRDFVTGLKNVGLDAAKELSEVIVNKDLIRSLERTWNEGKSFWETGFQKPLKAIEEGMSDEQWNTIANQIRDIGKHNTELFVKAFQNIKPGISAEEANKLGSELINSLSFDKLSEYLGIDKTASNAEEYAKQLAEALSNLDNIDDLIKLGEVMEIAEKGASATAEELASANTLVESMKGQAKEWAQAMLAGVKSGESLAKTQQAMAENSRQRAIDMEYLLLHQQGVQAQTDLAEAAMRKQEAEARIKSAKTPEDQQAAIEEYKKWENQIKTSQDTIIRASSELFNLTYTETFRRFNEELEKYQYEWDKVNKFQSALNRRENKLFDLKMMKQEVLYSQENAKAAKARIDTLRKLQTQIVPDNLAAIQKRKDIDDEILSLERQITDERIQQLQLTREMIESSFEIVKQVAGRVQREIDAMQFGESIKDRLVEINDLRLQIMELRGIWDPGAISISWDARVERTWQMIPEFIDGVSNTIGQYYDTLEMVDKIANYRHKELATLDSVEDADKINQIYKERAEMASRLLIDAKNLAKAEQERIGLINEQLRLAKQQKANQQYAYNELIKQKQDELDKLKKAKEEQQEIDELLKLRLELVKALDDVSHSYITGAGIEIMRPDESKVEEVRGKIEDKLQDDFWQAQFDALQAEIDALEEAKDEAGRMADVVIAGYEMELQLAQDQFDMYQKLAEDIEANFNDILYGIPPEILDSLNQGWERNLQGWSDLKTELDTWVNNSLGDSFMTPMLDKLGEVSETYTTGSEKLITGVDEFGNEVNKMGEILKKLDEDVTSQIEKFNGVIDGFEGELTKALTDFINNSIEYLTKLDDVLAKYSDGSPTGGYTNEGTSKQPAPSSPTPSSPTPAPSPSPDEKTPPSPSSQPKKGDKVKLKSANTTWYYDSSGARPVGTPRTAKGFNDDHEYTIYNTKYSNPYQINLDYLGWVKLTDLVGYKTGGLADYTGPAWLDGTPQNPEIVLNAQDTSNFLELTNMLRRLELEELWNGMTVELDGQGVIQSALQEIANILMNQDKNSKIYIDNVNLPNVQNATDFMDDLAQFVGFGRNQIL